MTGSIKLTRFVSDPILEPGVSQHLWGLRIHAQGLGDYPAEVFVLQRPGSVNDLSQGAGFRAVASAHDIEELPVTPSPADDDGITTPFFRSSQILLYLRSPEEVERVWELIQEDVRSLVRNLRAVDIMRAVDSFTANDDGTTSLQEGLGDSQLLFTLDYRPSGLADLDDGVQTILQPDTGLTGWLPVSEFDGTAPAGTRFFYNLAEHPELSALFPLSLPVDRHLLFFNGLKLTHGSAYQITDEGLFWRAFDDPSELPADGDLLDSQPSFGNAPWPTDYVDRDNPGASAPSVQLLVFL